MHTHTHARAHANLLCIVSILVYVPLRRVLIYMLGKSAKLQWGLGHKSLKTNYEGALIPLLM